MTISKLDTWKNCLVVLSVNLAQVEIPPSLVIKLQIRKYKLINKFEWLNFVFSRNAEF